MLVATSVATDTRVLREARALVGEGHEVLIIGKDVPEGFTFEKIKIYSASAGTGLRKNADSLSIKAQPLHIRIARWILLPQHRERAFAQWRESAYEISKSLQFDVVHVHDFNALELGYKLHIEKKIKFIYDSHEWWVGRQRQYRPTPFIDKKEAELEKLWGSQATAVITVGDSIAELFRTKRDFKNAHVVRNSFPMGEKCAITSPPSGAIYAGRIDAYRELETIIAAASKLNAMNLKITWMGEHLNAWATKNLDKAITAGIEITEAKSISDVTKQMQSAGLAFVTHSNKFESHRLAMPNKLFHAVHAGVPVIATNVTELANLVSKYDLGELYEPGNADSLAEATKRAIARHQQLIDNVANAQSVLSWSKDELILLEIYANL